MADHSMADHSMTLWQVDVLRMADLLVAVRNMLGI